MEASGGLLSWRDDPEKSGARNGLPGKEVYPTGRSRTRQTGGGGGEGCRCSFVLVCSAVARGGGGPLGWESNAGKKLTAGYCFCVFGCGQHVGRPAVERNAHQHITASLPARSMTGSLAQVSNLMHHWKV